MLVYLNVWVILLSAYNVYQEKILSEKFLNGFSHRFFFQVLPFHRNLLDFFMRSKTSLIKWKSFKFCSYTVSFLSKPILNYGLKTHYCVFAFFLSCMFHETNF